MTSTQLDRDASSASLFSIALELARRARHTTDPIVLGFMAVNDSHTLAPYRQAALWFKEGGVKTLSGVMNPEANAPYVQWINRVCKACHDKKNTHCFTASDLPQALAEEWEEWLPAYAIWISFLDDAAQSSQPYSTGGILFARDIPWFESDLLLLSEWMDSWHHSYQNLLQTKRSGWFFLNLSSNSVSLFNWRHCIWKWSIFIAALVFIPVHLTVLAPGELVPADPAVIRAPFEGVVESFFVKPNALVKKGDALFGFDQTALSGRLQVASQALLTAEAEYRQSAQQAVSEARSKAQLASLQGKIEEKRAEADYLRGQLERSRVTAPQDGIALFDDPSEWIGRPVATGERIMRVAIPQDIEVEAWLPVGDAIPLNPGSPVKLYLNASPLAPVAATIRYASYYAVQRSDGSYAYRLRARLNAPTAHRIGLKGTVKITGDSVPLLYWIIRRPLAVIRQTLGL